MTQIDVISDLHIDQYLDANKNFKPQIQEFVKRLSPKQGALIIAGDVSQRNQITKMVFLELLKFYEKIFFIPGNHDMYVDAGCKILSKKRLKHLKETVPEGVVFLCGEVQEYNNIRIGGVMMWPRLITKDRIKRWYQQQEEHDKVWCIKRFNTRELSKTLNGTPDPNLEPEAFYKCQEDKFKEVVNAGCDILVTHFPQVVPPEDLIPEEYRNDPNQDLYYQDRMNLVKKSGCEFYVFGHVHTKYQGKWEEISIVCNPVGAPDENLKTKILTIKKED